MKVLRSRDHVTLTIDETGTQKFEAFLDKNFSKWRESGQLKSKHAGAIERTWMVGIDDIERVAFYRGQYIEIADQYFDLDDADGEVNIHYSKGIICDIDGDLTPVAVWGRA